MAYIGNTPAEKYTSFTTQHFTVTATASYTLDTPVANENELALFINNVRQEPGTGYAYTAAGTALTLSAATAGTDTMYCVYLGKARQTVTPPDGSVTDAKLTSSGTMPAWNGAALTGITHTPANDSVDGDKIVDDAINSEHYATGSIDTAHIATNQIDETLMKDAFVGDFTDATVTASDYFLHGDATDSGNTKKDTIQGILDLVSAGVKVYLGYTSFNATSATGTNFSVSGIVDASSASFTPKAVFMMASTHGAGNTFGWIVNPSRDPGEVASDFNVGGNYSTTYNQLLCRCPDVGAIQYLSASAFSDGGFTMANTKSGSATGTLYVKYMAMA